MRSAPFLAAAVTIVAVAVTAGCGQQRPGSSTSGPGSPAGTPSAGPVAPAGCGGAVPTSPPDRTLTLTASDSGRSFCIRPGTGVLIYLKGTRSLMWTALKSSSGALVPRPNGHLMLALGVTGGYFVAVKPGLAAISSERSPCGSRYTPNPPTRPTTSGKTMMCGVIQSFRVSVTVAG
ncbi:MAG TPA: hypothetical protein VMV17_09020 [Streptosporangiaceae bacterium]|nr:hypothetical protein [Streptosporangiaceae bacterium]